jgi:hypothetical protein
MGIQCAARNEKKVAPTDGGGEIQVKLVFAINQ